MYKNVQMTVLAGKVLAAIAFIVASTVLSGCSTPEAQKPEVPTQPQNPQLNNQSNQQPNQQSNQGDNDDDDKDDDKDSSQEDKD